MNLLALPEGLGNIVKLFYKNKHFHDKKSFIRNFEIFILLLQMWKAASVSSSEQICN